MTDPRCPDCGGAMTLRTARRGRHQGKQFYGCRMFPGCRGAMPVPEPASSPEELMVLAARDSFVTRPEREVVTISRISTAECPFAYFKQYVERPRTEPAFESAELAVGQYFHDCLEQHLSLVGVDRCLGLAPGVDGDRVVAGFRDRYVSGETLVSPYRIVREGQTPADYEQQLLDLTAGFNAFLCGPLAEHTLVRAEGAIEIELSDLTVRGRYDLVTRDELGNLVLWDWKTGRPPSDRFPDSVRMLRMQLGLYATWLRHRYGTGLVRGAAVFLRGGYSAREWTFDPDGEREVLGFARGWRRRVNEWRDYPPVPRALCTWCGWNEVCPADV